MKKQQNIKTTTLVTYDSIKESYILKKEIVSGLNKETYNRPNTKKIKEEVVSGYFAETISIPRREIVKLMKEALHNNIPVNVSFYKKDNSLRQQTVTRYKKSESLINDDGYFGLTSLDIAWGYDTHTNGSTSEYTVIDPKNIVAVIIKNVRYVR